MRCSFLAFVAFWAGNLASLGLLFGLIALFIGAGVFVAYCAATATTACFVGGAIMLVGAVILALSFLSAVTWLLATMEYRRSCP